MSYCNCEDYPCCGHDGEMGPENAGDFLDSLDEDEREYALAIMRPCPRCGEMRPKQDPHMQKLNMCYMCSKDQQRQFAHTAMENLAYFQDMLDERDKEIQRLREELRIIKDQ